MKPEEIERMRDEALAAFAAAGDLDALQEAKVAHTGGTSPLALANREIGALPPHAKAAAGKLVGQARGAVNKALGARQGRAGGRARRPGAGRGGGGRHAAVRPAYRRAPATR